MPAGVHTHPLFLTHPDVLDYFILFLKNVNTCNLKTKNRTLRITPALLLELLQHFHFPSVTGRQRTFGEMKNEVIELTAPAKQGPNAVTKAVTKAVTEAVTEAASSFLSRCGMKTAEGVKSTCIFCSIDILLNMIWH